ncbi:HlyD family efflux transporter periplasmic adaptor subunit [Sporichthya brevicatena]|uniref:HlyD family efflux transporter periplasmic adaptor subunit n=1 Tax=Sporichthya brevicatena TaxID=171442 RepID=A0ABP3SGG0_9ACTN
MLVLAAGGTGAWALTRDSASAAAAAARSIVATVSAGTIEQTVSASGTINAADVAELSFPVGGTVTAVKATVGQTVTKGQVLARVGTKDLQRAVDVAAANVTSAQAQMNAASGSASLAAAKAQLATAKDKLAAAKSDLAAAKLTSPIDGVVAAVNIVVGDVLSGGNGGGMVGSSGAGSSSAHVTVVGTKSYVVDAAVSGTDLASVKTGQQARITPSGATQAVFGTVSSVGVVASSSSGGSSTFPVTIKITGTPEGLHPGGSATVAIVTKQLTDVLTVPTAALRQENGKTVVTKVEGDATRTVEVSVGSSYGTSTEVLSGLVDGDQVQVTTITRPAGETRGGNRSGGGGQFGGQFGGPPAGMMPGGAIPGGGMPGMPMGGAR